jgi:hypothetical protein
MAWSRHPGKVPLLCIQMHEHTVEAESLAERRIQRGEAPGLWTTWKKGSPTEATSGCSGSGSGGLGLLRFHMRIGDAGAEHRVRGPGIFELCFLAPGTE